MYMAFIKLREQARGLRKKGESIARIATMLRASKSTVSYWCRDIALSSKQIQSLVQKQENAGALGRLRAAEKKRSARLARIESESKTGSKTIGALDQRDIFMLAIALYWGEGYKSGNEECGFTNSNPDIIRAFILWLRRVYNVPSSDLILRVSINQTHRNRVDAVERYWSKATGVPRSQFSKASLIKTISQKIYPDPQRHFGTLRIKVRRGTALRRRILGSIEEIGKQVLTQ